MSLRNFYQTFYQTEQLFRLDNDPFAALGSGAVVASELVLIDTEPAAADPVLVADPIASVEDQPLSVPVEVQLVGLVIDPVAEPAPAIGPTPVIEQPVRLEAAPARTMPSTHRPERPEVTQPLLNHKVLILVDEELLPGDVLFLEKILNAINLNIRGVDLLNVHGLNGVDFEPILADKVIHHFLTFGVPFQRLNLDILMDRYQPVRFHGITFMMADPLAAIEGDKLLKKRLWEALKRIFLMG